MNKLNSQKGFVVPVVIAIVVVLIGGGIYLANKREVDSAKNISSTVSTVDWKTYANGKYGFEFKYPSDWQNVQETESPIPTQKAVSFAFKTPKPNDTMIIFSVADNGRGSFEIGLPSGYAVPDVFKREYETITSTFKSDLRINTPQDAVIPELSISKITFPNNSNKIQGGSTAPFLSFSLKADKGDVQIDSIKIKKTGTLSNHYLKNIFLVDESNTIVYDESVNRATMSGGTLNDNNELVMTGPILLRNGETQRFYLYVALDEDLKYAKGETVVLEISALNLTKGTDVNIIGDWRIKSPTMVADRYENTMPDPVINSITPGNGPVGTNIELKGVGFAGFEGDKNAIIENYFGQRGVIYGELGSTDNIIRFKLADRYCTKDNSYTGFPCDSYLMITPGVYKIYVWPWGKSSEKVQFIVTN